MKKVRVVTTTKKNTYDPQGTTVCRALKQLGINNIVDAKVGRHILLYFDQDTSQEDIQKNTVEAANKLLYNDIIEDYEIIHDK